MIEAVHIGEPARRARQYPHELSGGMRQRIMIAMALMAEPEIILADEPTTALDVTVQAQVLALLQEVRERTGAALVLVTHDLGVVAQLADRIGVMRAGKLVELAGCEQLFEAPAPSLHPVSCCARCRAWTAYREPDALLRVRALDVSYAVQQRGRHLRLRALRGVSFELMPGEALAVIGESGSGKSTLGRALLRLIDVDAGEIVFRGQDLLRLRGEALRRMRAHLQMIFQDGLSALDPRMQIGAILGEPLQVFRPELDARRTLCCDRRDARARRA